MKLCNEAVLQEILEQSLAGYWDWDIPSGNEYLSPSFKKMFGYEDHEIENRADAWQKLIFAEDLPGVLEIFKQHVASRGAVPYRSEIRYHHKNGSTIWVICTGKVIEWDDSGNPLRMVGCHIDITERKLAELNLKKSQQLYQELVKGSQDLVWQCDAQGRYTYLNPAWEKVFDYRIDEMLGKSFADFQSAQQAQRDLELFGRLLQTNGFVNSYETVHLRKDGTERHLVFNAKVLYDENGQTAGTRGTAYDITERKHAEESLRQNEAKLRAFVANQPGVAFTLDRNGVFTLSEGLGLVKLGLKPGQVVGLSVFDFYRDIPEIGEHIKQALTGNVRQFQVTVNKTVFDVWTGPIMSPDGTVDGVIGISSDISASHSSCQKS